VGTLKPLSYPQLCKLKRSRGLKDGRCNRQPLCRQDEDMTKRLGAAWQKCDWQKARAKSSCVRGGLTPPSYQISCRQSNFMLVMGWPSFTVYAILPASISCALALTLDQDMDACTSESPSYQAPRAGVRDHNSTSYSYLAQSRIQSTGEGPLSFMIKTLATPSSHSQRLHLQSE
jgi:hypothetical protein